MGGYGQGGYGGGFVPGGSTISVQSCFDVLAGKGIPDPRANASGYGSALALDIANSVMADIIAERFNWKWNRVIAPPFYTNSFQCDYPQVGIRNIGWGEDCDRVDINNTANPKPIKQISFVRELSRPGMAWSPVSQICWMYNSQLTFGVWPGAGVTFYPLVAAQIKQNPIMSMIDTNGNLLIVTTVGTTGGSAPVAAANATEGTTVTDGSVIWTVVSPNSQGFRVSPLPGAAGPVWQVVPICQLAPPKIAVLTALINPIPDDQKRFFQAGIESYALDASPNPGDKERAEKSRAMWFKAMHDVKAQADKEQNAYALLPATMPVENIYTWVRNPQDPSQPY